MPSPSRKPPSGQGKAGGLGFLTRKAGPLPVIAWAGIALVAFLLYRHYTAGSTTSASGGQSATPAATDQSGTGNGTGGGGGPADTSGQSGSSDGSLPSNFNGSTVDYTPFVLTALDQNTQAAQELAAALSSSGNTTVSQQPTAPSVATTTTTTPEWAPVAWSPSGQPNHPAAVIQPQAVSPPSNAAAASHQQIVDAAVATPGGQQALHTIQAEEGPAPTPAQMPQAEAAAAVGQAYLTPVAQSVHLGVTPSAAPVVAAKSRASEAVSGYQRKTVAQIH